MTKPIKSLLHVGLYDNNEPQLTLRNALRDICEVYNEMPWPLYGKNTEDAMSRHDYHDVIFLQIQSDGVLSPSYIKKLKEAGARIFHFSGDVRSELPKHILELAPYVTTLLTNKDDVKTLTDQGYDAHYFQIGYDHTTFTPEENPFRYIDDPEIVFQGNDYGNNFPLSKLRRDMVAFLQKEYGDRFAVFGNGFKNAVNLNNKQEKQAEMYRRCKIAINLSHFDKSCYSSDRLFRIMGSGAFCLSHRYKDIEQEFMSGVHLDTWETAAELRDKINMYLKDDEIRNAIANHGHKKVVENYTWPKRMEQLISLL